MIMILKAIALVPPGNSFLAVVAVPPPSIRRPAIRQNRFFWCASCFLGSTPSSRPGRPSLQESDSHDLHRRCTLPPYRQAGRRHGDAGGRRRQSLSDRAAPVRRGGRARRAPAVGILCRLARPGSGAASAHLTPAPRQTMLCGRLLDLGYSATKV